MLKNSLEATPMKATAASRLKRAGGNGLQAWFWGFLLAGCLILANACGELRPVPEGFDAPAYKPIEYQHLQDPAKAGLKDGDLVRVKAYFWQYLTYDPAMVRNYLTLPRYPIRWYRLRWFAIYGSDRMEGYYDLAAMSPEQEEEFQKIKRLDHVLIYGELSPLKPGLFLRVHHIEKIEEP
jgi:hypothetical protein